MNLFGECMLQENIAALKWLYATSSGNRGFLYLSVLLAALCGAAYLIPPWVLFLMATPLLQGQTLPEPVWLLPLVALGAILVRYVLQYASTVLSHMVAFRLYKQLRRDIITHMGRLPLGFFTTRSSGALRKIMGEDIENLEIFIGHHVPDTAKALAVPVMAFVLLAQHDAVFALCAVLPLVCAGVALVAMFRAQQGRMEEYFDNVETMNGAVVEYIKAMPVVKVYNLTMDSYSRLKAAVASQVGISASWARATTPFYVLFKVGLDSVLLFLIPCAIVIEAQGWAFALEDWLLALVLSAAMIGPIDQIYTSSSLLSSLFEGINRVDSLLKEPALSMPEQGDMPKHYDIAFRDVSFSYGANDVLSGVSVELGEGKLHAFVGASGAGKSTAAQLLLRFWDVQSGGITIGGKDIRDISYDALMSMVSFVFQDSFLLDATVAENIALGQPDAPRERIVAAARTAQAHGFIEQLEHGYDTRIGSGGTHLSGGEKQRIAIARALFKDCPIIVFDEATSSSDTGKQAEISRAIKGLAGEKTVIVITHHLSTALGADQILVFDHGRLAGSGAHGDLLEGCAEYRHLWEKTAPLRQWVLTTDGEVRHAAAH